MFRTCGYAVHIGGLAVPVSLRGLRRHVWRGPSERPPAIPRLGLIHWEFSRTDRRWGRQSTPLVPVQSAPNTAMCQGIEFIWEPSGWLRTTLTYARLTT